MGLNRLVTLTKFAVANTLVTSPSAKMPAPSGEAAGSAPSLNVSAPPSVDGRSSVNLMAFGFGVGSGETCTGSTFRIVRVTG